VNAQKQKMKFLAVKLTALKSELKVSREILNSASREVESMFNKKYFPEQPAEPVNPEEAEIATKEEGEEQEHPEQEQRTTYEPNPNSENLSDIESAAKKADPEVKSTFRKIAMHIHPDKLGELPDGFEKAKKTELFDRAREALENNDILTLSDVAMEIGIDIPEITELKLKQTEEKVIAIKKELNQIESSLVWHWFFTNDTTQKDDILKKLFELMYANNPRP